MEVKNNLRDEIMFYVNQVEDEKILELLLRYAKAGYELGGEHK